MFKMIRELGATRFGVWAIKHIVTPIQRWLYKSTGGEMLVVGGSSEKILLLTTKGRKSGKDRTVPVFYLRDEDKVIVCNVNPGFERTNPWDLNIRANPTVYAQIGHDRSKYQARELSETELLEYWPRLVELWPAYQSHYDKSGKRTVFELKPSS